MLGVAPNAFIDGNATTNWTACVAETGSNCTGSGITGTYHLTGAAVLAAPNPAIIGTARSFYFITNFNGTIARPVIYASNTGNDTTGTGLIYTSPVQTYGKALSLVNANDDGHGGTVCLMDGGTFSMSGPTSIPSSTVGLATIQSASQFPCVAPGDPGGATVGPFSNTSRSYFPNRNEWRYVNLIGNAPTTLSGGMAWYLYADHVTAVSSPLDTGGLLGTGGFACVESTSYFGHDGACSGAVMARNVVAKYFTWDGLHDVAVAVRNSTDFGGPQMFWATGDSTSGSPTITNVTLPAELAGHTLTSIFTGMSTDMTADFTLLRGGVLESSCFGTGSGYHNVIAVSDSPPAITLDANATTTCTGGNLGTEAHGDNYQVADKSFNPQSDLYVAYNNFGILGPGIQQGYFLEGSSMSGVYTGHNSFQINSLDTESMLTTSGGNELVIYDQNTFLGNRQNVVNRQNPSAFETYGLDLCPSSGTYIGTGTNIRAQASGSACYSTSSEKCTAAPVITQTGTGLGSTITVTTPAVWSVGPSGHTYGWYKPDLITQRQSGNGTYTVVSGDVGTRFFMVDLVTSASGPGRCASAPLVVH